MKFLVKNICNLGGCRALFSQKQSILIENGLFLDEKEERSRKIRSSSNIKCIYVKLKDIAYFYF